MTFSPISTCWNTTIFRGSNITLSAKLSKLISANLSFLLFKLYLTVRCQMSLCPETNISLGVLSSTSSVSSTCTSPVKCLWNNIFQVLNTWNGTKFTNLAGLYLIYSPLLCRYFSHSVLKPSLPKQSKRGSFLVGGVVFVMNFSLKYSLSAFTGSGKFHIMLREILETDLKLDIIFYFKETWIRLVLKKTELNKRVMFSPHTPPTHTEICVSSATLPLTEPHEMNL